MIRLAGATCVHLHEFQAAHYQGLPQLLLVPPVFLSRDLTCRLTILLSQGLLPLNPFGLLVPLHTATRRTTGWDLFRPRTAAVYPARSLPAASRAPCDCPSNPPKVPSDTFSVTLVPVEHRSHHLRYLTVA